MCHLYNELPKWEDFKAEADAYNKAAGITEELTPAMYGYED